MDFNSTQLYPPIFYQRYTKHGLQNGEMVSLSTRMILSVAQDSGIQIREIPETRVFALTYKDITRYFHAQIPWQTREVGFHACLDKSITKGFLREAGISTPNGYNLLRSDSETYWEEVYHGLQKPVVVKPTNANQGRGITMNVDTVEKYKKAVAHAFAESTEERAGVVVEETCKGTEYRILATKDKVIGILNRVPANIVGDGVHTIQELIEIKNSDPRRSDNLDDALVKIKIDEHVLTHLSQQNLSLTSIPDAHIQVFLRLNSNISTGGDSVDMTDEAHSSVHEIALKVMQTLPGLQFAGIDFMTTDITQPQTPEMYSIIEVNSSPGFCIHDLPHTGNPRDAAKAFIHILFPELLTPTEPREAASWRRSGDT